MEHPAAFFRPPACCNGCPDRSDCSPSCCWLIRPLWCFAPPSCSALVVYIRTVSSPASDTEMSQSNRGVGPDNSWCCPCTRRAGRPGRSRHRSCGPAGRNEPSGWCWWEWNRPQTPAAPSQPWPWRGSSWSGSPRYLLPESEGCVCNKPQWRWEAGRRRQRSRRERSRGRNLAAFPHPVHHDRWWFPDLTNVRSV